MQHFKSPYKTQTCSITFHGQQTPQVHLNQTDYNTEVNTIKYIAQENGYDRQLTESLIENAKRRKLQTNKKETHTNKKS